MPTLNQMAARSHDGHQAMLTRIASGREPIPRLHATGGPLSPGEIRGYHKMLGTLQRWDAVECEYDERGRPAAFRLTDTGQDLLARLEQRWGSARGSTEQRGLTERR